MSSFNLYPASFAEFKKALNNGFLFSLFPAISLEKTYKAKDLSSYLSGVFSLNDNDYETSYKFLNNINEIILSSNTSLYSFPEIDAKKLMVLDSGTSITILRNWRVNEREIWVRVQLASNQILDDPNKITKGWIIM